MKIKIFFLIFFLLCACSKDDKNRGYFKKIYFLKSNYSQMHDWNKDNHLDSLATFARSCKKIMLLKPDQIMSRTSSIANEAKGWQLICKNLDMKQIKTNLQARKFYEKWFIPYKVLDNHKKDQGIVTGYYEVSINGHWYKTMQYKYPVYGAPYPLIKMKRKQWISHAAINRGSLRGKGLEVVWVDDLARLYWMQIQGSGLIQIETNSMMRLGYDGENGFEYTAIGPFFKKYGARGIKSALDMINWVHKNPTIGRKLIEHNRSYVFFKKIHANGPIGRQGIPLISERSVAIDDNLYPLGMPLWLETTLSNARRGASRKYHRLFIAQDRGGAIKGPLRVDIFFGHGNKAEKTACRMNNKGRFFVMFPRSIQIPKQYTYY